MPNLSQSLNLIFTLFIEQPHIFIAFVGLISLCAGSFLNVVIYRLPKILNQGWYNECQEYLYGNDAKLKTEKLTLSTPRSACPSCHTPIKAIHNIPVLSWVFLRGKCSNCKAPISFKYPLVEILTAVLSMVVAAHFQFGVEAIFAIILTWGLIALTFIDFSHQILPDRIVFPLIGMGLFASTYPLFGVEATFSIYGLIFGFLSLWVVYIAYKFFTGKEGMGYGDFKLLALCGAWFGSIAVINTIVISSILGLIVGIYLMTVKKGSHPFAFGPYIAIGIWITMIFGSFLSI